MTQHILGLSAYYHDSAAALLTDGRLVAAAQEERFSRVQHDSRFPAAAIRFCLDQAGVGVSDLAAVVFYDKPLLKFERLLETYVSFAPRGFPSFLRAMPVWLRDKLYLKETLRRELGKLSGLAPAELPPLRFSDHHRSHAASAFYFSPFDRAAVLCLDGVGEWATSSLWQGSGARLEPLWEIDFPHSLGLLYSAFTGFAGFAVNAGEYKLMGLAPYGEPRYVDQILGELMDLKADGSFRLNLHYFDYCTGLSMTSPAFAELFGGPPRRAEAPITRREMDLAASVQRVTEDVVLRLARTLHRETGETRLCLAGGVALNCVANGRLLREGDFAELWIQPAAGDAGGALGAAALAWHEQTDRHVQPAPGERSVRAPRRHDGDGMRGALLGPAFGDDDAARRLDALGARYTRLDEARLLDQVAARLAAGRVVGWFQGRMEFGPRALGCRSILADPRDPAMQSRLNLKIKFRESFRPFAPAVMAEKAATYFALDRASPYMLIVAPLQPEQQLAPEPGAPVLTGLDRLGVPRSRLPAVTHVDGSARVQTVDAASNPRFYRLLAAFEALTGCPVLVNTSFNRRDEPIVCTPEEAWHVFMLTEMDDLVIGDLLLTKSDQVARPLPAAVAGGSRGAPDGFRTAVSRAELRRFGLTLAAGLVAIFGILMPVLGAASWPLWPWPIGLALAAISLVRPGSLGPVRSLWLRFGHVMSRLTTPLLLGIVFYLIVSPIGLIRRGCGRDPLQRRFDPTAASYRVHGRHSVRPDLRKPF